MMWRYLELWFDKILLSMCSLVYRNWLTDENKQQNKYYFNKMFFENFTRYSA